MTEELLIRSDLDARTQARSRFHRLLALIYYNNKGALKSKVLALSEEGIRERRKVASYHLGKEVESFNDLYMGHWNKLNESLKTFYGVKE